MIIPDDLSECGRKAADVIAVFLDERGLKAAGFDRIFYTPKEWRDRGEKYGLRSELIVVHDGGAHAPAFNWDYRNYDLVEQLRVRLQTVGCFAEQCTTWYSAVYCPDYY